MMRTATRWIAILSALAFAGASAHGWWSYFSVGPAEGPSLELALVAGMLAAIALFVATITGRPPRD